MLNDLDITEQIVQNYAGLYSPLAPALQLSFLGREGIPWKLNGIRTRNTSGPAIMLTSHAIRDENLNVIVVIGIVPWQFANTTIEANTTQTPDQPIVSLFAFNIGGSIASGLRVLPQWSIQANALNPIGASFDADFFFSLDDEQYQH